MTKSAITRERLEWLSQISCRDDIEDIGGDEIRELASMALAAMDSEPVAYTEKHEISNMHATGLYLRAWPADRARNAVEGYTIPLYRHAQPAPVVPEDVRQALSKMDDEIIAELDAEESVCRAAMLPAAPVRSSMPDGVVTAEHRRVIEMLLSVCGAAFELADDSCQQDVDGEECHVVPSDAFQKLSDALDEIENTLPTEDIDRPDVFLAWSAMPRAALKSLLQAGKSPAIPDGYVMVPKEPTAEMILSAMRDNETGEVAEIYELMLAAAPQSPGSEPATVPGKWIPVIERMPERGDYLVTDGCDFDVQLFNGEQFIPGCVWEDKITHWMPLPAAPQGVIHG